MGEDPAIAEALERATVASGGELRPPFACLRGPLGVWKDSVAKACAAVPATPSAAEDAKKGAAAPGAIAKKRVLMLGSGMVAPPAVAELCSRPDVHVVVGQSFVTWKTWFALKPTFTYTASNVLADAERLTKPFSNATPVLVDTNDSAAVERLVAEVDVVIR